MNRRQMIMLPGAALVAQQASAQIARVSGTGSRAASQRVSHKILLKYDRPKSIAKVPKNGAKAAKYLSSLNTLLELSSTQYQQAEAIFAGAVTAQATVRSGMKFTRQGLTTAIRSNDSASIGQLSAALGTLEGQHTAIGANANAAFFQLLTADQQNKLTQIKSRPARGEQGVRAEDCAKGAVCRGGFRV